MAHFFSLIRRLSFAVVLFTLLCFASTSARAELVKEPGPRSCTAAYLASYGTTHPNSTLASCTPVPNSPTVCNATIGNYWGGGGSLTTTLNCPSVMQCPANSSETNTGACACNSGFTETGSPAACVPSSPPLDFGNGQCVANAEKVNGTCQCKSGFTQSAGGCWATSSNTCVAKTGSSIGDQVVPVSSISGNPSSLPICDGGCVASGSVSMCGAKGVGSFCWLTDAKFTGATCTGTDAVSSSSGTPTAAPGQPATAVPPGKCPGTVNGVEVLVTCDRTTQTTGSTSSGTTTNSTGSGTSTTSTTTSTGVTSSTTKTECTAVSCTTTVTTTSTSPAGVTGTTTTEKTEPKEKFCTENPKSPMCITSSFGGACSSGFTCDGDAVQCAIAKETYRFNCSLEPSQSVLDDYNAKKNKSGNQVTQTVVEISSASFNQDNLLGVSATCVADKPLSMTVAGKSFSVTLPFSKVCPYLEYLGYLNLALTFILSARIIGRG